MLTTAQKQALNYKTSLCVTASAGTGKTHVLVNRYIHLLEESGCKPSEILALTFTEKAAAEMKDRVLKEIYSKEGEFWTNIKDELMWARIGTIHSFCYNLLKEFSYESGLDPSLALIDEHELALLMDEGINNLFLRKEQDGIRQSTTKCLNAWGEYYTRNCLSTLYHKRHISKKFFRDIELNPSLVLQTWLKLLENIQASVLQSLKSNEEFMQALEVLHDISIGFGGEGDATTRYLKEIQPYLEIILSNPSPKITCDALATLSTIKGGRKNMGSGKVFGENVEVLRQSYSIMTDVLKTLPVDIICIDLDPTSPAMKTTLELTRDLGIVFEAFVTYVEQEKRKSGMIDFSDMINLTYDLVNENASIAEKLNHRFRFIMIDEFQDTDPMQTGILMKLLTFGDEKHKKLFIVGDPKQSIYLFRDADVTQFKGTRKTIETWGGVEVPLDENFRSTPQIIQFINPLFERIFIDTGNPWDFSYEKVCHTKKRENDVGSVELLLTPKGETALLSAILEFSTLAEKIGTMIRAGEKNVYWDTAGKHLDVPRAATFRDIAVLVETRTHLLYLLSALSDQDIPYRIHGGIGFYQTEEIVDLNNLCSFLCNPSDDIALYGILRSPYFSFSDAELYTLGKGRGEKLYGNLKHSENEKAKKGCEILDRWLSLTRVIPVSDLLQQIIDESEIFIVYSALPDGAQKIANLEKIFSFVREHERAGYYTIDRFVRDLLLLIDSEVQEGEAEPDTDDDMISIMTVHSSKGLEFPIVCVPRISETMRARTDDLEMDHELGIGIKIPSPERNGEFTKSPPFMLIEQIFKQKDLAEYKRLFYVAATRAKDHLILSGTVPDLEKMPATPETYNSRIYMLMGNLGLSVPGEGQSYQYDGIPGLKVKVTMCKGPEDGTLHDNRVLLAPTIIDIRSFKEHREFKGNVVKSERIFSASEIELYLESPEKHRDQYIDKVINWTGLTTSALSQKPWTEGQIIHEIFSGKSPESVLKLRGLPADKEKIAYYQTLFDTFRVTSIMQNADQTYTELPFLLDIEGFRVQGFIDILVHTSSGWAVVDYKSGASEHSDKYRLQMAIYKMAAEAITKEPVDTWLYYIKDTKLERMDVDVREFRETIKSTCNCILEELNG